jgi:hypothetical protein
VCVCVCVTCQACCIKVRSNRHQYLPAIESTPCFHRYACLPNIAKELTHFTAHHLEHILCCKRVQRLNVDAHLLALMLLQPHVTLIGTRCCNHRIVTMCSTPPSRQHVLPIKHVRVNCLSCCCCDCWLHVACTSWFVIIRHENECPFYSAITTNN